MTALQREDFGLPHTGKYAAYVRVSTDSQDVATQEHSIKEWLNGGDHQVKWFREEGVSSGEDWHNRQVLQDCLTYCRKQGATLIIYSLSRLARKQWEALRFFEQQVYTGKIKMVVIDDPTLDETSIGFRALFDQHEREKIRQRTKASLARIQAEIAEKGSYTTKEGKTITKLGVHDRFDVAQEKGNATVKANADKRAAAVWPIIQKMLADGESLRAIARHLNQLGVASPSAQRKPDAIEKTFWHASTVNNYIKRMEDK